MAYRISQNAFRYCASTAVKGRPAYALVDRNASTRRRTSAPEMAGRGTACRAYSAEVASATKAGSSGAGRAATSARLRACLFNTRP